MNSVGTPAPVRGGRWRMRRSRGATSGFLLVLLGLWGALIPFVGPYFNFGYTADPAWTWTDPRGWLEVLPGAVTVLGGLLLLSSRNRATAMLGGWLAVAGGAWFVVGRSLASVLNIGSVGTLVADTDAKRAALEITYFYGLGALIAVLGGIAVGRVSVRSVRDVEFAHAPVAATGPLPAAEPEPATVAQPMGPSAPTEQIPTGQHRERERRSWRDLFSRRHTDTPVAH